MATIRRIRHDSDLYLRRSDVVKFLCEWGAANREYDLASSPAELAAVDHHMKVLSTILSKVPDPDLGIGP